MILIIEPLAFKSMLCFIYSDSLPEFEVNSDTDANDGEKQDLKLMAHHLLVAADRFDLERLKLMCEDFLYKNLDVSTVASTLILAERHNCNQLKARCLGFMSSPGVLKAVAPTDAFHLLMKSFPSILKDI
ncbi:BTB/POZ and MATH domain-containing protein 2 [Rhynchospora pubera]|uniref:BTB/POZ and MATH domain-containing protein 2 n=1 Tax=Rhynchospora pubera TaxID=906938 RepID=A0AAV8DCJ4_9POAL|nr:BTB/POZ and MATH domain-containing protein 2 [Rhynchospora pubera]